MDISGLFPSSDNLYKFLFIGGLTLIVLSFAYPLEKQRELKLQINEYKKAEKLLGKEISYLKEEVSDLKIETKKTLQALEQLNKNKLQNQAKIDKLITEYNSIFDTIKIKQRTAEAKNIELNFEQKRLVILKEDLKDFAWYKIVFLLVGIGISILSVIKWYLSTKNSEKLQDLEIEKREKDLKTK